MTDGREFFDSNIVSSCHVETVVLLGREKVDGYILVDLDVEKLDGEGGTATYTEIKDYVKEKYGFSVSSLYISDDRRNPHSRNWWLISRIPIFWIFAMKWGFWSGKNRLPGDYRKNRCTIRCFCGKAASASRK